MIYLFETDFQLQTFGTWKWSTAGSSQVGTLVHVQNLKAAIYVLVSNLTIIYIYNIFVYIYIFTFPI